MDYKRHYENLIESRKNRIFEKDDVYEIHHIIPKSLGGEDIDENRIKLTPREHFLAHWLLWRIHRNREMSFAFFSMCQYRKGNRKQFKISSRAYEEARISRKNVGVSDETRKKMSEAKQGKIYSEETRKRMSIAKRGCSPWNKGAVGVSDKTREKLSLGAQNRKRRHADFFKTAISYKEHLTERQIHILEMIVSGHTNSQICDFFNIKDYEIMNTVRSIRTKINKLALSY